MNLLWTFAEYNFMFNSKKMVSKGYTLWLMPKGEVYNNFFNLIKKLAREYQGPLFVPHVTLLGEIELSKEEIIKRTKILVQNQKSFPIVLKQIAYEEFFFRALIVLAQISEPLQKLHERAKKIFEMNIPAYMPHLSILYGEYTLETKKKIISEIGKNQEAAFEIDRVFLIKGGEVKNWKIIEAFTFS